MPKYLKTKEGSIESAVLEAMSPAQQAAIAISKKEKEKKEELVDEDKAAYEKFFKSALKKFGVDSPADFKSDEEKKKFFDYVDKNYKSDDEKSEAVKEAKKINVYRVTSNKMQGNVHAKDEKEAEKIAKSKGMKGKLTITFKGEYKGQPRLVNSIGEAKMVCKDCGCEQGNPVEDCDCPHDSQDLNASCWVREDTIKEETLAMKAAKHIASMWEDSAKKAEEKKVKQEEEETPKKKESKTAMTGKPMAGVEVNPKEAKEK